MADKERHNSRVDDGEEIEGGESRPPPPSPLFKISRFSYNCRFTIISSRQE